MQEFDPIQKELERVGVKSISGQGEFLRGYCPFHTGSSGKTFSFNRETGRWSCFSTRCAHHKGGDFPYLLYLGGLDMESAKTRASAVINHQPTSSGPSPSRVVNQSGLDSSGKLQSSHLSAWRVNWNQVEYYYECEMSDTVPSGDRSSVEWNRYRDLKFMVERGIRAEPLMVMDVGYDPTCSSLTFPLRNPEGSLLGVARRVPRQGQSYTIGGSVYAPGSGKGRFFKVNRGECLWGWHEQINRINAGERVVVVEGYADALKVMGAGHVCVAKMSSKLTSKQIEVIANADNEFVFWPDMDTAGLKGVSEDVTTLIYKSGVRAIIPEYPDPAETPEDVISSMLDDAIETYGFLSALPSKLVSL